MEGDGVREFMELVLREKGGKVEQEVEVERELE